MPWGHARDFMRRWTSLRYNVNTPVGAQPCIRYSQLAPLPPRDVVLFSALHYCIVPRHAPSTPWHPFCASRLHRSSHPCAIHLAYVPAYPLQYAQARAVSKAKKVPPSGASAGTKRLQGARGTTAVGAGRSAKNTKKTMRAGGRQ